jgi:hypothetical protein
MSTTRECVGTGSAICNEAIKFVTKKTDKLDTMHKVDERIENIEGGKTTEGLF